MFRFVSLTKVLRSVFLNTLLFVVTLGSSSVFGAIDLERKMSDPFVITTKRIFVPQYPLAFNPSIVRWNGANLLSFRVIPDRKNSYVSYIGLTWLDDTFDPVGAPQLLDLRGLNTAPSRAEDARLILVGKKLYMVYSDNPFPKISRGGFRVHIGEVIWDGLLFSLRNVEVFTQFEGETQSLREKNWVPFEYDNELLLAYSLEPHVIFRPLFGYNACETISSTPTHTSWKWGVLRGGTTALREGNSYLSFFHSSIDMASKQSDGKVGPHYFMGAYLFDSTPPFAITHISPKPIIGESYYEGQTYKPYWKPVIKVVFPCGFISDDAHIWISYGRDDHEMWITTIDKKGLLESLVPVTSEE